MAFAEDEAQVGRLPLIAVRNARRRSVQADDWQTVDSKPSDETADIKPENATADSKPEDEDDRKTDDSKTAETEEAEAIDEDEPTDEKHPGSIGGPATLGVRFILESTTYPLAIAALRKCKVPLVWSITGPPADIMVEAADYGSAISAFQKARLRIHPLPVRLKQILDIAAAADKPVVDQFCRNDDADATEPPTKKQKTEDLLAENGPPTLHKDANFGLTNLLPSDLLSKLKPYQKQGIAFVRALNGRAINADEMGLGKTLQAICVLLLYRTSWPALIITPSSLKSNWRAELIRWTNLTSNRILIIQSTEQATAIFGTTKKPTTKKSATKNEKLRQTAATADIFIIAYDLLVRDAVLTAIDGYKFQVIVADESHSAKNRAAKRTQCLIRLCAKAPYVLLLSGTPSSSPEQWFSQLCCVQSGLLPPFWIKPTSQAIKTHEQIRAINHRLPLSYISRWSDPFPKPTYGGHFVWQTSGCARASELYAISSRFAFVRRTVKQVLKDMPAKDREKIVFDVPTAERERIAREMAVMKAARDKQPHVARRMIMEQFNDLPRLKESFVRQYLTDLFDADGEMSQNPTMKVLLFYHHRAMHDVLIDITKQAGLGYIEINGDVPSGQRQPLVDRFQTDPACRVGILSITAAGTGLNMQAASLVIMTELFWTPSSLVQAEARAYRIGIRSPVFVKYLVAEETLDDILWRILTRKQSIQGVLFDNVNTAFEVDTVTRTDGSTDDRPAATDDENDGLDDISRALAQI